MAVYLVAFAIIFILYHRAYSGRYRDPKKVFLFRSAIVLVLLFGSMHNQYSFSDVGMYYNLYKRYIGKPFALVVLDFNSYRDSAFFVMTWILAQIVKWPQFFMYFEAAIFIGSSFWFIYKNSENPFLSVMVLFGSGLLSFCLSAYRQAFAISCCLFAFEFLKPNYYGSKARRLKIVGIVLYAVAIFMHRSAIAFVIALAICYIRDIRLKIVIAFIGAVFLRGFGGRLFQFGANLMGKEYVAEFHMSYLGHIIQMVFLALPIVMLMITRFFSRSSCLQKQGNYTLVNEADKAIISVMGCIIYAIRTIAQGYERIAFFYFPFTEIAYSTALDYSVNNRSKKITNFLICILCVLLFFWRQSSSSRSGFVFFWQR